MPNWNRGSKKSKSGWIFLRMAELRGLVLYLPSVILTIFIYAKLCVFFNTCENPSRTLFEGFAVEAQPMPANPTNRVRDLDFHWTFAHIF